MKKRGWYVMIVYIVRDRESWHGRKDLYKVLLTSLKSMETRMELAKAFHDLYEMYAPDYGYETREETKVFDPQSPNGKLMLYVCQKILMDYDIKPAKGIKDLGAIRRNG